MRTVDRTFRNVAATLICWAFLSALPAAGGTQPQMEGPAISAALSFRCLWWSEAQMEGLNPNSPPLKTNEVRIEKWEYSDPIGVPHPDVIDLVVELRNTSGVKAKNLRVKVSALWKTGPLRNKARAVWGAQYSLRQFSAIQLESGGAKTLRVPVDLAEKMKGLEKRRSWPWMLRVQVSVASASGRLISKTMADLPIFPGD